jgi:hypothetical protein
MRVASLIRSDVVKEARMTLRMPLPRRSVVALGVAGLTFLAAAAYLASPLVIRTRVVEENPFHLAASSSALLILGRGMFSDRDQVHRGSGEATVAQTVEGTTFLRFESFRVTNGPDLHVFLSRAQRPGTHDEVYDGVYVGKLKASEGAFSYELPPGTDFASLQSVVVYCVPFRTIFTSAPLLRT